MSRATRDVRRARWPRRQLPAYSPLAPHALGAAAAAMLRRDPDAPRHLRALLAREYGADSVLLYSSGTAALQCAIEQAVRHDGRRVVALPAYSCFDLASAAVGANAQIVLYDVDPGTLGPDIDSFGRALQAGATAAVVAPLYGVAVDWDSLTSLAHHAGVRLIEDAAQGQGARYRGRMLGSLAASSVLSFGRGKGWTGGAGGALLLRGASRVNEPAEAHGDVQVLLRAAAQWLLGRAGTYGLLAAVPWLHLGETVYRAPVPPRRMAAGAAAIAFAMHAAARDAAAQRRAVAAAYDARLPRSDTLRRILPEPGAEPGYLRYPLRVPGGMAALADTGELRRLGVMPGYPSSLGALQPVRERLIGPAHRWPGAEQLSRDLITLPTHERVTAAELDRIVALCSAAACRAVARRAPSNARAATTLPREEMIVARRS